MATRTTPTNPRTTPVILTKRLYTWMEHAERHYKEGTSSYLSKVCPEYLDPTKEALMFLCIMAHYGMFSS